MQDTCVFVSGSDNRRDVLDRVLPSVARYWADCPYPIYLGLNSAAAPGFRPVVAPPSGWRTELTLQLRQLRERHVILLLDDFLVEQPVNQARIEELLADFRRDDLRYLRLLPLGRSIWQRIGHPAAQRTEGHELIGATRPFHSSLQIAIWLREHLLAMLEAPGSIWEFEHRRLDGVRHHAIRDRAPIRYQHVVEKGRWQPYAKRLLRKAGFADDLGTRPEWSKWAYCRVWLDELRFFVRGIANH